MIWGPWDELDDHQSPLIGNPYQIWYYHTVEEGKHFVFEDWSGTHEFRLVHSNVDGEIFNELWEERMRGGYQDVPGVGGTGEADGERYLRAPGHPASSRPPG